MPGYIDPDPPKEEKLPSRTSIKNGQDDEAKRREQLRKEREARTYTNDVSLKIIFQIVTFLTTFALF